MCTSIDLFIYLGIHLSISTYFYLPIHPSIHPSISLSIYRTSYLEYIWESYSRRLRACSIHAWEVLCSVQRYIAAHRRVASTDLWSWGFWGFLSSHVVLKVTIASSLAPPYKVWVVRSMVGTHFLEMEASIRQDLYRSCSQATLKANKEMRNTEATRILREKLPRGLQLDPSSPF